MKFLGVLTVLLCLLSTKSFSKVCDDTQVNINTDKVNPWEISEEKLNKVGCFFKEDHSASTNESWRRGVPEFILVCAEQKTIKEYQTQSSAITEYGCESKKMEDEYDNQIPFSQKLLNLEKRYASASESRDICWKLSLLVRDLTSKGELVDVIVYYREQVAHYNKFYSTHPNCQVTASSINCKMKSDELLSHWIHFHEYRDHLKFIYEKDAALSDVEKENFPKLIKSLNALLEKIEKIVRN